MSFIVNLLSPDPPASIISNAASLISASSSLHPRPHDRFCIPQPTSWETRRECLRGEWYDEHEKKTFQTLQYRKSPISPWHESIVLLLNDKSACVVERMGDATAPRQDALFPKGIPAVDYMQVFPPDRAFYASSGSNLVAEIEFPQPMGLLEVLDICYAIQLDPEAKRYTLQSFNCYFFAWTIILILGRKVAGWDRGFSEAAWSTACNDIVKGLGSVAQMPRTKLVFKLEKMLSEGKPREESRLVQAVASYLWISRQFLRNRAKSLLWIEEASGLILHRVKRGIRRSVSDASYAVCFPEVSESPWRHVLQFPSVLACDPDGHDPASAQETLILASGQKFNTSASGPNLIETPKPEAPTAEVLTRFIQAPMYETSSLVLDMLYQGAVSVMALSSLADGTDLPGPEQDHWYFKLERYIVESITSLNTQGFVCDEELVSIIDSNPQVDGLRWRQALIQVCDAQVPFFRSSPLLQFWDHWLWNAIEATIMDGISGAICSTDSPNIKFRGLGHDGGVVTNKQLQDCIRARIEDHSGRVSTYTRKPEAEVQREITETIEEVWERMVLGSMKREASGLTEMCQAVVRVVDPHFEGFNA